jgi:tetratricopeptide (TPR) repeat protein
MKTIDFSYFIERYNAGEMSEAEKAWFHKELEGNPKLREEVTLRKKADIALKSYDGILLRNKLTEIEKRRTAKVLVKNRGKHLALKYAALVAGLIILSSIAILSKRSLPRDEIIARYYKPYEGVSTSRSLQTSGTSDNYSIGLEYYNVHDYRNAALYFSKVLSSNPKYMESVMHYGVSNYEEKNFPEAKNSFIKVIDNNDNLFIEDAQWYLALCYIQTDDIDKAADQLAQIKKSESIYRKDAAKILRKMK